MGKNRTTTWKAACLLLAGAVVLLSGCGRRSAQHHASSETEAAPIVIEQAQSRPEQAEADIIIEQPETDGGNAEAENADTAGDGAQAAENGQGGDALKNAADHANPESVTLLFAGDVLLSDHVLNAYQKSGGIQGVVDDGYRNAISDADFFMVNQEFPFSGRGTQAQDKQYTFRLPPEKVSLFTELGIDAVTLANNHALDFGADALLDSCQVLDDAGILHTGAGADLEAAKQPVRVELGGRSISVIGATRVIPVADWAAGRQHPGMLATYDPTVLLETIKQESAQQDYVFVLVHWGIERDEKPQEYQRALAKQYIDAGADCVIGAHPHVLQGIEYYNGKPIVYSLGNFVFGSSIPRTMLLEVKLTDGGNDEAKQEATAAGLETSASAQENAVQLRVLPGTSGGGYTRMLTDAASLREFYRYLESISFGVAYGEDGSVRSE